MNSYLVIIILALAAMVLIGFLHICKEAKKHGVSTAQELVGICSVAMEQTIKKGKNKKKILELLAEKGELNNSDIREALGISARTAVNYMDELEKENKVKQVGRIGHNVIYRLK